MAAFQDIISIPQKHRGIQVLAINSLYAPRFKKPVGGFLVCLFGKSCGVFRGFRFLWWQLQAFWMFWFLNPKLDCEPFTRPADPLLQITVDSPFLCSSQQVVNLVLLLSNLFFFPLNLAVSCVWFYLYLTGFSNKNT